jgi:peptidoglycan/LPS O-acetylase OafA/YrhL
MDVVLYHALITVFPLEDGVTPHGLLATATRWLTSGHLPVMVFIVLSGYSLALSASRRGYQPSDQGYVAFLRRRFQRIYPAYLAALLVSLLFALTVLHARGGTHWDAALPVHTQDVFAHLFLVHDLLPPSFADANSINHALWSVPIEFHLYLLFPLLLFVVRRVDALVVALALAGAGFVVAVTVGDASGVALLREAPMLGAFAIGIAATRAGERLPGPLERWWPRLWPVLFLGGVAAWIILPLRDLTGAAAFAVLLVALHRGEGSSIRRLLETRALLLVGVMSYSLYLIHAPLLELLWRGVLLPLGAHTGDGWAVVPMLVGGLAVGLLGARVLFVLVERPTLPTSMRVAEERELASATEPRTPA